MNVLLRGTQCGDANAKTMRKKIGTSLWCGAFDYGGIVTLTICVMVVGRGHQAPKLNSSGLYHDELLCSCPHVALASESLETVLQPRFLPHERHAGVREVVLDEVERGE